MLRNYTFNLIRNVFKPIVYPLLFVGYIDPKNIIELVLVTFLATKLSQKINYQDCIKHRYLWAFFQLNYLMVFPFNLIMALNRVEQYYNGNLFMLIVVFLLEVNFNMVGFILEDLIFGDLKYIFFTSTIITGFYLPFSTSLVFIF